MPNPVARALYSLSTANNGAAYAGNFADSTTPTAYVTGAVYRLGIDVANTGAATVNFNSIGTVTMKKYMAGAISDLAAADLVAGQIVEMTYDGTYMQVVSRLGSASSSTTSSSSTTLAANSDTSSYPGTLTFVDSANSGSTLGIPTGNTCLISHTYISGTGTSALYNAYAICQSTGSASATISTYVSIAKALGSESFGLYDSVNFQTGIRTFGQPITGINIKSGETSLTISGTSTTAIPTNVQSVVATLASGAAWSPTWAAATESGLEITLSVIQAPSGTAGTVTWPSNVYGAMAIPSTAGMVSTQKFKYSANAVAGWYAVTAGLTYAN